MGGTSLAQTNTMTQQLLCQAAVLYHTSREFVEVATMPAFDVLSNNGKQTLPDWILQGAIDVFEVKGIPAKKI